MSKLTICLDFDGVCHSYTSGWMGIHIIPDPPVDGLFGFISEALNNGFDIAVYSTRSESELGIEAMKQWFEKHSPGSTQHISFPDKKPLAFVGLDDRVITFDGVFPDIETLKNFKPWNKK